MSTGGHLLGAAVIAAVLGVVSATFTVNLAKVGSDPQQRVEKIHDAAMALRKADEVAVKYATKNHLIVLISEDVNVEEFNRMEPSVRVTYVGNHPRLIFFADGHYRPAKD